MPSLALSLLLSLFPVLGRSTPDVEMNREINRSSSFPDWCPEESKHRQGDRGEACARRPLQHADLLIEIYSSFKTKLKCKNQAACSTPRLTAKGKPGGEKKGRFVVGPTAALHFQSLKTSRLGFSRTSAEVPLRSPLSQSGGPGTLVGGHAGDGEIFSTWALLLSVCLFPDRSPESWSQWSFSLSVVESLAHPGPTGGPWRPGTGCCRTACGGHSGRASLGSLSARLGMGRGGSRKASHLKDTRHRQGRERHSGTRR